MGIRTTIRALIEPDIQKSSLNAHAKRMGLNQPTLHRLLSGETKTDPTRETLERIARYYKVTVDDLYSGAALDRSRGLHQGTAIEIQIATLRRAVRALAAEFGVTPEDLVSETGEAQARVAAALAGQEMPDDIEVEEVGHSVPGTTQPVRATMVEEHMSVPGEIDPTPTVQSPPAKGERRA